MTINKMADKKYITPIMNIHVTSDNIILNYHYACKNTLSGIKYLQEHLALSKCRCFGIMQYLLYSYKGHVQVFLNF